MPATSVASAVAIAIHAVLVSRAVTAAHASKSAAPAASVVTVEAQVGSRAVTAAHASKSAAPATSVVTVEAQVGGAGANVFGHDSYHVQAVSPSQFVCVFCAAQVDPVPVQTDGTHCVEG